MLTIATIGLEPGNTAPLEPASASFLKRLLLLVRSPRLHVNVRRGYPACDLCGYSVANEVLKRGPHDESVVLADVVVPWHEGFFVFPTLLYHYCVAHQQEVPRDLVSAVEALDLDKVDDQLIKARHKASRSG